MSCITDNQVDKMTAEDLANSLDSEDYIFVLDKEGQLKLFIVAGDREGEEIHDNVLQLLEFFGVNNLENHTLH